jgi:hypothetical protein
VAVVDDEMAFAIFSATMWLISFFGAHRHQYYIIHTISIYSERAGCVFRKSLSKWPDFEKLVGGFKTGAIERGPVSQMDTCE